MEVGMPDRSRLVFAAALVALATPAFAAPGPAPQARAAAESKTRMALLQSRAAAAEAKINGSAEARAQLAAATPDAARAVLLRNGFTPEQLEGVAIRVVKAAPTPAAARIKSITIKVSCCPPEIVITIRF
jgi:hypothetical protein